MKNIFALFFSIAVMVFATNNLSAQEKSKTEVTSVKQKGETIRFTLTSSKKLIFGDNRYVLYIGDKEFVLSEVPADEDNRIISFLIKENEFSTLKEGAPIYMTYGHINVEEHDMQEFTQNSRKCWSLGAFSKAMLTK